MSFWDSVSDVLGTSGKQGVGLLQQKPEDLALAGLAGYGAYAAAPYLAGMFGGAAAAPDVAGMTGVMGGTAGSGAGAAGTPWYTSAPFLQGGASLVGGLLQSNAQRQAATTQSEAAQRAIDLQQQINQQQLTQNAPFYSAGVAGQNKLLDLLGLSGNTGATGYGKYAQDFSMNDFQADPGYAFRLSEGQKALERSAAARGGLISGGAMKAATRFGQDLGSQEYQNAYNRYQTNRANQLAPLGSLAQSGQAAANYNSGALGNYGTNVSNLINQQGQNQAASELGAGNTFNSAIKTGISAYQNNALLDALKGYA